MKLNFTKVHGLGNDFVILNNIDPSKYDLTKLAIKLCHRQLGIGADGIMLVLPSDKADIRMRIINSDGSEAEMCGNGIRCFAKYVYENKIVRKTKFSVETLAGLILPELVIKDNAVAGVKVNMGQPFLKRSQIPMNGDETQVINEPISVNGTDYKITSMLMGVPHTMVFLDHVDGMDVKPVGHLIEHHPLFPQRTNVNFVEVNNSKEITVRTWERGAGATLACGTGSCASAVASYLNNKTGKQVLVHLIHGDLFIEWAEDGNVYMTGPAETVFQGEISI